MAEPVRVTSPGRERELMDELLATVTYAGPDPAGTRRDEHGLPVVDPHPDEDPDERI